MDGTVRRRLLDTHRENIEAVIDSAQTVARALPEEAVSESAAVSRPLGALLDKRDLHPELLAMPHTGAAALDESVAGTPVPAPPYLVVTGVGPVCRATLSDGRRLVVAFRLFDIDRRPVRYRFADPDAETCLDVRIR